MSGKVARRLATDINTRRGLQQLQKTLHLDDDTFGTIDWESFGVGGNSFRKTIYSTAHFCKHVCEQWHTESRAHKYDDLAPDRCRCCTENKEETTEHIFQCSSRKDVHKKYYEKFIGLMGDKEIPNDILSMFEVGIDIALFKPLRTVYDDDILASTDIMADIRVTRIMNEVSIREDRREAFAQQTRLGWTKLFLGYMTEGWRISTEEFTKETNNKWTAACSRLFIEWGQAC